MPDSCASGPLTWVQLDSLKAFTVTTNENRKQFASSIPEAKCVLRQQNAPGLIGKIPQPRPGMQEHSNKIQETSWMILLPRTPKGMGVGYSIYPCLRKSALEKGRVLPTSIRLAVSVLSSAHIWGSGLLEKAGTTTEQGCELCLGTLPDECIIRVYGETDSSTETIGWIKTGNRKRAI